MSALAERLRGVIRPIAGRPSLDAEAAGGPDISAAAADILGGEWHDVGGQRFLTIDRKYPPGHRHGHMAVADTLPPTDTVWPRLRLLSGDRDTRGGRMLFVDLETTGLAGGAGTYAFVVGCAWYQDGSLRARQFFLSNFSAERALLEAVADTAAACGAVVTYNGKSFDLPLIETRFLLHRLETPFAGVPHVDMLHPARRLWRQDDAEHDERDEGQAAGSFIGRHTGSCRLGALEQTLCGHVRDGDVPGFEIPSRYFHFVRTGDARGLATVMEHNRLDLVSLAMLTARASQLLEEGPAAATTAREALGMGRLYEKAGLNSDARASYKRAAESGIADILTRAEAWRAYSVLSRRERCFEDAAQGWRRILELDCCPVAILREAAEALAVHHEHRLRDPGAARMFALQSLGVQSTAARREATEYRLARLNRKLGEPVPASASLF